MRFLKLVILCSFMFFAKPSYAEGLMHMISHGDINQSALDTSDVKKWNKTRKNGGKKEGELVKDILTLQDQGKILASLDWLRDLIKEGETDYVYPFMYARQLQRTGFLSGMGEAEVTARAMAHYSKLLLMTDAKRCDDNGVGTSLFYSLSKELAPVERETDDLHKSLNIVALNIALFMEDTNKKREKQRKICESGIGFIARALQSTDTKTVETIAKKDNYYGHISGSKVTSVDAGEDVEAFYISNEAWNIKRNEIRDKFKRKFNPLPN